MNFYFLKEGVEAEATYNLIKWKTTQNVNIRLNLRKKYCELNLKHLDVLLSLGPHKNQWSRQRSVSMGLPDNPMADLFCVTSLKAYNVWQNHYAARIRTSDGSIVLYYLLSWQWDTFEKDIYTRIILKAFSVTPTNPTIVLIRSRC